ncbi:MAG: hypothetical protein KatS3mg081_2372 [Gemmatimonadales bacterium]|nr:hypothetical protein HRbin33_00873 [bacterium HR33]GIW53017.1 MAG: hypothetical protein KatS3mg081_2372 [Gemmatimonadales bacterium]
MVEPIYRFAESLRHLLRASTAEELERRWDSLDVEELGWRALDRAWRARTVRWERVVDEVDGLLNRLLDRLPRLPARSEAPAVHLRTFREPALERLQHAAAAALVAQRFGTAGLRTVVADEEAPLQRRYFAFLALAVRHPRRAWPLFARYLTPEAHHAFCGAAAEAARFYPEERPAPLLVELFEAVRSDLHLRAFLSPRILESLYVLGDPAALPLCRELLVSGHTAADPEHCEVTRALVIVRSLSGAIEPNVKYPDTELEVVRRALDQAEELFRQKSGEVTPVVVM